MLRHSGELNEFSTAMINNSIMSQEEANVFLEKMKNDTSFREAVTRIEDVKAKVEYIHRKGYSFTSDELEFAMVTMPA
jgi:predicted ribosomally synthesized peptide with nif11-like leader